MIIHLKDNFRNAEMRQSKGVECFPVKGKWTCQFTMAKKTRPSAFYSKPGLAKTAGSKIS
jgi:hypothetical protein